jgi:hypothetical protein
MSKSKKISLVVLIALALWFLLDMTGFAIGDSILVISCFVDEPIDAVFFIIFIIAISLYAFKENVGKWLLGTVLALWIFIQGQMYFMSAERLANYNNYFSNTHHIIEPSSDFLIKDTYHIVLDILIMLSIIAFCIHLVSDVKKN